MSKAIRIHKTGGPEVMMLEDVTLPPLAANEVTVRHHAIGINYIDIYFRTGMYPAAAMPFTPGNEGAGEVVAVGAGVEGFKIGDRVAYVSPPGSYCEERNINASILVKLPTAISYETGAAMMLKGLTAQYLLRQTFPVKAGDTILVHAAAGGVGLLLCQWGRALGATVIGTVGSKDKAKLAEEAGAHHIIFYREEDFAARVTEITKGRKCDVVYDGVGKDTFMGSLDSLRPLGYFVSYGSASGPIAAFDLGILSRKGSLFVTRPTLFTYTAERARLEAMSAELFEMVGSGKLDIPIHNRWKLADAVAAHTALEGRTTTGVGIMLP